MNYKAMRMRAGLTTQQIAAKLKAEFPKANKMAVSIAERPDETGVEFTTEAKRIIETACEAAASRKTDGRRDREKLQIWLSNKVRGAFNNGKLYRRCETDKAYLIYLIEKDQEEIKNETALRQQCDLTTNKGGTSPLTNFILANNPQKSKGEEQ